MSQEILWNWDSTEGVASLNRKAMPSQGNASKAKSVQKQSIGEAKVITKCIARTSTRHAGRPILIYLGNQPVISCGFDQ